MSTMLVPSLTVHPYADLIPRMSDEEHAALVEDIRENGQQVPITIYEGQILDGRHRALACETLGIEPITAEYTGNAPAAYVLSLNVTRRQLNAGQRAMVARDFLPYLEDDARARQAHGATAPGRALERSAPNGAQRSEAGRRATEEAGALVGVSARQVQRAKRVDDERPDLAEAVRAGDMALTAAEDIVAAKPRRPERSEWNKGKPHIDPYRVFNQTLLELEAIPSGLQLIDRDQVPQADRREWSSQLRDALKPIAKAIREVEK